MRRYPGYDMPIPATGTNKPTKQRAGDQPLPKLNENPYIQDLVIKDIKKRMDLGVERYGTALQGHNGRDVLRDAYEEAVDLAVYLRQLIWERDNPKPAVAIWDSGQNEGNGE